MEVNEIYWEMISIAFDIADILVTGYFTCRFLESFLTRKRKLGYVGLVYIIVMFILWIIPQEVGGSIASAIGLSAVFIMMYFIDRRNMEQKVFLVVVCYLWEWVAWGILIAVWNVMFNFSQMIIAIQKSVVLQFVVYVIMQASWIIMEILIMQFLVRLLHRIYIYKTENMTKNELVLMLAPLLSVAAGRFMVKFFVNVYEIDLKKYVWENHHGYNLILFLYQMISFAAMLTVIAMYQGIKSSQRREKEETVLARQIEDMEKHIGEVEKLYNDIRSLKHDMRNHVMVLENLYGKNEEAKQYAAQLKKEIDDTVLDVNVKSGNPITDIIIMEKQKEAEEKNIDFQYEFHYPQGSVLNAFDVSVILNNALNNAIEAVKECGNPYIRLFSYNKNNTYMIEVRNSITKKRDIDSNSGLPITTKKDEGHGYGLVNIRKMSQKYFGDIDIEQDENEFRLTVMLLIG